MSRAFTHPDVLRAAREGASWADPQDDPRRIDWPPRQAAAAIPFAVVGGRPVNPCERTGITRGRNELGHWGEQQCADAIVIARDPSTWIRFLLMVERADGHGWALPGGYVDPGETATEAAQRELHEETGLGLPVHRFLAAPALYVPDPRASDEAWMVTTPCLADLGWPDALPEVKGADDARRAAWLPASSYEVLTMHLAQSYGGRVFPAHVAMLQDAL